MMRTYQQQGFSLIEVLIAIFVFGFGMLGIALYTANAMRATANNHARGTIMQAVAQTIEPMIYPTSNAASLTTNLTPLLAGLTISNDNGKDSYLVRLVNVINGDGASTIAIPATPISPVTAVLNVSYNGANGQVVTLNPIYTFYF
ncbi:MAG: prepilin-type N-terminal cleavage/methylation domain-containing protein [Sideroxydans sp.]|nr:prepilin-type N-terminal cleavage/methylation domain-containing protein [Sideroxydans sp.]